jgi:hypothetical protein
MSSGRLHRESSPYEKYQFVSRSGSTLKFWVFKARSPCLNVGFFNRYTRC